MREERYKINIICITGLQMKRFETRLPHVMRFSNLMETVFLTGRFKGDNTVRGQFTVKRS